jgi:hypothetical protein
MIRILAVVLVVAVVGAVPTVVLPAASFARDRMKLVAAQDRVAGHVVEMGRLADKVCRGLADDSYDQVMRAHAQALRVEGAPRVDVMSSGGSFRSTALAAGSGHRRRATGLGGASGPWRECIRENR